MSEGNKKLIKIMEAVKEGVITIMEAEQLFKFWLREHQGGNSKSFKDHQEKLVLVKELMAKVRLSVRKDLIRPAVLPRISFGLQQGKQAGGFQSPANNWTTPAGSNRSSASSTNRDSTNSNASSGVETDFSEEIPSQYIHSNVPPLPTKKEKQARRK